MVGFYTEQRLAAQTKAFTYLLWFYGRLSLVAEIPHFCSSVYNASNAGLATQVFGMAKLWAVGAAKCFVPIVSFLEYFVCEHVKDHAACHRPKEGTEVLRPH